MRAVGHPEREAQHCVIPLFHNEPGHRYFSNLEAEIATAHLVKQGMMQERLTERSMLV